MHWCGCKIIKWNLFNSCSACCYLFFICVFVPQNARVHFVINFLNGGHTLNKEKELLKLFEQYTFVNSVLKMMESQTQASIFQLRSIIPCKAWGAQCSQNKDWHQTANKLILSPGTNALVIRWQVQHTPCRINYKAVEVCQRFHYA